MNELCHLGNHMKYNCGTVCIYGKYIKKPIDKEKFILHLFNIFNQSLIISKEYYQSSQFVVELYLGGVTFNNLDPLFLKEVTILFQTMYPDKLLKCIIFNPPIIFKTIWDIIKRIIDSKTKQKIEIYKPKNDTNNTDITDDYL